MTKKCEKYNWIYNKWSEISDIPVSVQGCSACCAKNKIFVFGGKNILAKEISKIQVYNISTDFWNFMKTQLPEKSYELCSLSLPKTNEILIFGQFLSK